MDSKIILSRSSVRQMSKTKVASGTSLAVWLLRLHTANAGGTSSVPNVGTTILCSARHGLNKLKKNFFKSIDVDVHLPGFES